MIENIKNDHELHSFLWDRACTLRKKMESNDYKNYLFPLIFYKYICDTYDGEYENEMNRSGNTTLAEAPANHRFQVPSEFHWKNLRNLSKDLGAAISRNLIGIQKANLNTTFSANGEGILDGIFGDANWGNKQLLPDYLLKTLIEEFSKKNLSLENIGEDALGNAYEYLLGQFADDAGQGAQEFFTNRTLVTLMVNILGIHDGDSIYDPTCGTAGMLIMSKKYADSHDVDYRTLSFYGQELYQLSSCISRMNMLVHDIEDFNIKWGDTISNPAFTAGDSTLKTFNIVLANPPYSIKINEKERKRFEKDPYKRNILGVPKSNMDFVFVQHILKSMDPETGRAAILLPHGLLSSLDEIPLREKLISSDLLECVIGISKGLFFNSPMEACVFICRSKKSPERKGKIKFIEASKLFVKNGNHNDLSPENIEQISKLYFDDTDVEGYSKTVTIEELLKDRKRSLTVDGQISRLKYPDIEESKDLKDSLSRIKTDYHECLDLAIREVDQ